MANNNVITLVGNITDDPELRFTPSGAAVANFTVAVNRRQPGQNGGWEDKLDGFFRCSCWREMAENVAESLQKGTRVVVTGRLQQRSWEEQEGNRRSAIDIQVDEIGPSLRWATAQVTKSTRSGGQEGRQGSGDWGERQSSGQGSGGQGSDWGTRGAGQGSGDWGGERQGGQGGERQGGQGGERPGDRGTASPVGAGGEGDF
jgi:single-strand DNA-binding protein